MDFWARRPITLNLTGLGLFILIGLAITWVGRQMLGMFTTVDPIVTTSWSGPVFYLGLFAATHLVTRLHDHMPAAWSGVGVHRWTLRELGLGLGLGAAMALLAWGPIAVMGGVAMGDGWSGSDILYFLIPMTLNAAGEEILFRGYLFQRVVEIIGPIAATLIASALFAIAHSGNPNVTFVAIVIIFLGGIFFSLAYLRTGSLWLPIGAHIAWNVLLAKVLGLPVSGKEFGDSLLRTSIAGPEFLTGGSFGPEGGLLGAAALALGVWGLLGIPAITYSPYVYASVFKAFRDRRGATDAAVTSSKR